MIGDVDFPFIPRPLQTVGYGVARVTAPGPGEVTGRLNLDQADGTRVRCLLRDDDAAYLEDLGRLVMAGSTIGKLQAEHSALQRFVEAAFPGLRLIMSEAGGKPEFALQRKHA